MTQSFTESIVVPVADQTDARKTATELETYDVGDVTVLHVVEKGDGVPDKTPVVQSEEVASESFAAFHESFPEAETRVVYRRDVVRGIMEVAQELDASAIVFRPRGGARILQFLSGDRSLRLITEAKRPVIALTEAEDDESADEDTDDSAVV
ncbi:universal stress protein [Haloferax sp. YSMS24]|uniref:universal stress protein n=1 Tax=Haloferax sp. YSMS24 TaxID=3388425 RepID=UPI00398D07D0